MAVSTCAKCSKSGWEIKENTPKDSLQRIYLVQCMYCGSVVGVMEDKPISQLILDQNKIINRLAKSAGIQLTEKEKLIER